MMNIMKSGGMMKKVMQMQKQLKQTQKELEKETVTGRSKEDVVLVILTGSQKCKGVKIDREMAVGLSPEKIEKLFEEALVDALEKSKKLMAEKIGPISGGLGGLKI